MIAFIDDHREAHGVEPICKVLPIAPSTYHDHVARRHDPARLSARAKRDMALKVEVRRVFEENFRVYGVRKVWRQLQREGFDVARCTVARLMREMGLEGAIRGKPVRTTVSDKAAPCPLDKVNRQFHAPAPNRLWVSDFTYVATWAGFVYVAFVIDAYARRIVGWRVSRTAHAGFVLDALEQALHDAAARPSRWTDPSQRSREPRRVQPVVATRSGLTGLQALVQSFGGSSPSEGLAGPCIERVSNNCEYVRTVCAQIGSFREVLSKQSIGVLVRSALPRAVRFAEVDGKAGCDPQIRMPGHLCSLVPGQRAAKLRWQCRDRPGDGIANRFSPMTGKRRPVLHARDGAVAFHSGKMQQHCEPRGAFHQSADRRSAQADDQVTFPVSGYGPISCFRRSFTDHDLRRDEGFAPAGGYVPEARAVPFPCEGRRSAHDGVRRGPVLRRAPDRSPHD